MSTLDGFDLFGSGPHAIQPGPWERCLERRAFAGIDGELILDLGMRSRRIVQTGRLQAASEATLRTLVGQIESRVDGAAHTLVDSHGRAFGQVVVERFEPTTPFNRGRGYWCDYRVIYRELP